MALAKSLSASRMVEFLGCWHRSALSLQGEEPCDPPDATLQLIISKGREHEADVLQKLEEGLQCQALRVPPQAALDERVGITLVGMNAGAPLIYQGALCAGRWIGFPDFLVRHPEARNGRWLYRPEDAKLSRRAKRDHVLQIAVYAELLKRSASIPVGHGVIHSSGGEPERFDLPQTEFITARLMERFEEFASSAEWDTRSLPCGACEQCGYYGRCEDGWRTADSPIFVAGLNSAQLLKLETAGTLTLSALADLDPGIRVRGIGQATLAKLTAQARLQRDAAGTGCHSVEVLPVETGRGFTLLPLPQPGDLFIDLEGDPLYPEGLEYLFGLYGALDKCAEPVYRAIWAHDHTEEKAAFETVIDIITAHLQRFPLAHIYYYAQYEPAAFKRLAMRYATREEEMDDLLRGHRFVDLYRIARQAIRASTESYSLKDLEKIYWGGRDGAVSNAADSIVQYEHWRVLQGQKLLDSIAHYNEEDCISTARMRDWLQSLRPASARYSLPIEETAEAATPRSEEREAFERHRRELAARVRASTLATEAVRDVVTELLWFYQRAQKPAWWGLFERQRWSVEELIDDAESLGGLVLEGPIETIKRSYLATYRFPPQDTKLREGVDACLSEDLSSAGTVEHIQPEAGIIRLKRGIAKGGFPATCSLLPGKPLNQRALVDAVLDFAARFAAGATAQDRALIALLQRKKPKLKPAIAGNLLAEGEDLVSGTVGVVKALDQSYLIIQGPPGTGKTYTTAHTIVALLKDGKRVGVSSNSHKAINNVLTCVEKCAEEQRLSFRGAKKGSRNDDETAFEGRYITTVQSSDDIGPQHQLVGGTAFHFANEALNSYDYLFVDEAGQVALGNLVAMAGCAKNLVLVGDQMQLPQPVQGVHPGETGLSCLEYLLQNEATVVPDRGILLNISYRIHPALCGLVSEAIYDGRLTAAQETAERCLVLDKNAHAALKPAGIAFWNVEHDGCTQSSAEEAQAIAETVASLLRQRVRLGNTMRRLTLDDILVVAPFNMQVATLKRALPEGARVGTVDKFQGQEAAVVIVSMTTSHGDDAPRGTAFLFNRNRFNVAISRAQCLAIVVQSPKLQDVSLGSVSDLVRLNLFARAEQAAKSGGSALG